MHCRHVRVEVAHWGSNLNRIHLSNYFVKVEGVRNSYYLQYHDCNIRDCCYALLLGKKGASIGLSLDCRGHDM